MPQRALSRSPFHKTPMNPMPALQSMPLWLPYDTPTVVNRPVKALSAQQLRLILSLCQSFMSGTVMLSCLNSPLCVNSRVLSAGMPLRQNAAPAVTDSFSEKLYSTSAAMHFLNADIRSTPIPVLPCCPVQGRHMEDAHMKTNSSRLIFFFCKTMSLQRDDCAILKKILEIFLFLKFLNLF